MVVNISDYLKYVNKFKCKGIYGNVMNQANHNPITERKLCEIVNEFYGSSKEIWKPTILSKKEVV